MLMSCIPHASHADIILGSTIWGGWTIVCPGCWHQNTADLSHATSNVSKYYCLREGKYVYLITMIFINPLWYELCWRNIKILLYSWPMKLMGRGEGEEYTEFTMSIWQFRHPSAHQMSSSQLRIENKFSEHLFVDGIVSRAWLKFFF